MDIVIIGTGNVAAVLGQKFKDAGHHIIQVAGRNAVAANELAYKLGSGFTNNLSQIKKNAELYLVAVNDAAIAEVIRDLSLPGKVIAHTAGAVSKDVLKPVSSHYGVFYPLQSLRKEMTVIPEIPILLDASDETAKSILETLAKSISSGKVSVANEENRMKTHVAAVIVSNFTNHLYALAEDYCRKENIDFSQLVPLIEETAMRIRSTPPAKAQTGPAIRNDKSTIEKHLQLLENHPHLKKLYGILTESIITNKG